MRYDFDKLLTLADIPTLESLIGAPAVQLLQVVDYELVRASNLRKILLTLRPPHELLLDRKAWEELVDLLPDSSARTLAAICDGEEKPNPWLQLKAVRFRRGSTKYQGILGFFGIEEPELNDAPETPDIVDVEPEYSLFPHQETAVQGVMAALNEGERRVVLHMPTGSGKTRTAMHVIAETLRRDPTSLVIWLAYSEELCEQAATEFETAWNKLGVRSACITRFWGEHEPRIAECKSGFLVAGLAKTYARTMKDIQFIARLADRVSLVVIDEAHQAIAKTYSLVLDALYSKRPETRLLGLTATPGRSWDDIDADEQLSKFFARKKVGLTVPGYPNPVDYLIHEGYLALPVFRQVYSASQLGLSARQLGKLERALDVPGSVLRSLGEDQQRNLLIVTEIEKLARTHQRILVFAASVESALLLATVLETHGVVPARAVTGTTSSIERAASIDWFKDTSDEPRVLSNFGVLTTGFDAPRTSAVVIARPTKSLVLYSQMVGRGTRGTLAGGNKSAEIVTVVDTRLPGFGKLSEAFLNWEDAGWKNPLT